MVRTGPMLSFALACCAALLLACGGGGDSAAPNDPFPNVAGNYNITGGFDGLSHDQASFVGSLTINQASTQTGDLTGTMSVTATIEGDVITTGAVPLQSASVAPNGMVSFQLGSLDSAGSWTFTGTSSGGTIRGRHTLTDGSTNLSGDWTASTGSVGTGALTITASTSGSTLDPDGYTVVIDGGAGGNLTGSSPVTISGLAPGNHAVGLGGVAGNCTVQGDNPRLVTVASGATATVSFNVVCATPPPTTGTLRVTTTTTGDDLDPDGYQFSVDGGAGQPIETNASAELPNTAAGSHSVVLSNVATNCSVDAASKNVTVTPGATATIAFVVTCTAIPPATGIIRITTSTSGPDPDSDGYQFALDGGASQTIGVSANQTVSGISVGSHTVLLSGVASNCSVADGLSRNVTVTAGQIVEASYTVTCTAIGPSASRSSMLADPKLIATGSSATVTVTVRNSAGTVMAGVPVTLSSSGTANTITPASATTDASGKATFSFSSTFAGDKTISATAGGVTLDDTEVITVSARSSTTTIISVEPEPSTSGDMIHVTVSVTGEGGGTPTGGVTVSSNLETGGCTAAPIVNGTATCDFPLSVVGTHTINAFYPGDGNYDESADPDGQAHVVTAPASGSSAVSK